MRTVREETTLVGVSEFRTKLDHILAEMEQHLVVLERRNKPVAVMLPLKRFEQMEALLDWVEDMALGAMALERLKKAKPTDYIPLEEVERRLKRR